MSQFVSPRQAGIASPDADWVFLGKDVGLRERLVRLRGRRPLPTGRLLRETALELRGPFLEMVARIGRGQAPASWWAGTLAWKAWAASDLFLLCCYQALAKKFQSAATAQPGLLVVVEDPWLLRQIKPESAGIPIHEAACAALGLARRVRWAMRMAWSWLKQRWYWGAQRLPTPPQDGVVIYSFLLESCLGPDQTWIDRYIPGLAEELRSQGRQVLRCTSPEVIGWEKELAKRRAEVAPLILHASLGGWLRALLALPPRVPGEESLAGTPVGMLLQREWWHDLAYASSRCAYLFLEDCARRFLRCGEPRALVMPWENQPHERMLLLAAHEAGMRTVGYQHTTVPLLQLPFFAAPGEAAWAPLPDVIVASGDHSLRLLAEGGIPGERLLLGGSRRFAGLKAVRPDAQTPPPDVLVILPIDRTHARHLLRALALAYPEGGGGFRFLIKPHPAVPLRPSEIPFPAEICTAPMAEALGRCNLVIFSGTTAGLEALLAGHPTLRYRPESLLDLDPCEMIPEDSLPTSGDGELRDQVEALRGLARSAPSPEVRRAAEGLFAEPSPEAWQAAITGGTA